MILVNSQRTSKALMSVVHSDPAPNRSINVNKTEIMESMHFNENPALANQRGAVSLVSLSRQRQTRDNAVSVGTHGPEERFMVVQEEGDTSRRESRSRDSGRRGMYEDVDDRRRAKEEVV